MPDTRGLHEHEQESVNVVAGLHRKHDEAATGLQRVIDAVTDGVGRPIAAVLLVIVVLAGAAAASLQSGGRMDGPLALWLHLAATLTALVLSVLILASQRRSDALAARRSAMILELALLADQKNAKIVALLEDQRRGRSGFKERPDRESEEMSTPIDPDALVEATDESIEGSERR